MNFIELCLLNQAESDEIDDYIDAWHQGPDDLVSLADYLGFSPDEYKLWVEYPASLDTILHARKYGRKLRFD